MNEPMKFCMVTTFYPPYNFGGDGVFVHRLANELGRRGHSVDVVHCRDAYAALDPTGPRGVWPNHENVTVHALESRLGFLSPALTQQFGRPALKSRQLRRVLGSATHDVTHFHNVSLVGGPGVLSLGSGIKLYTMHEYWLVCPTHVLFKNNREACVDPKCFACCLAHGRPPQLWRYTGLLERSLANVDAFLAPSQFAAQMHRERGLRLPIVHMPLFAPDPTPVPDAARAVLQRVGTNRPFFLYVGRLERLKGVERLVEAFRTYDAADLVVVGAGGAERNVAALAEGLPHVHILGALAYDHCQALYERALAAIVPSLCYETFGLVAVEAFSMRTPVIARDTGALREIITESGGGLLYTDDEGLVAAMERIRTDSQLRTDLARRGYDAYTRLWTRDRFIESYLALVDTLRARREEGRLVDTRTPEGRVRSSEAPRR